MKRRLLALLFCFPACLPAQQEAVYFENIGLKEGLSSLNASALYRDNRGFLWIGTADAGLNRFDGTGMEVFRHSDRDSTSLCSDAIFSILGDEQGFIWVGANGGISRLNPATGRCRNFTQQNGRLAVNAENRLFQDGAGAIWTRNAGSLERYDPATQRFVQHPASKLLSFAGRAAFDAHGNVWIGSHGLKSLDPVSGALKRFLPYPYPDVAHHLLETIEADVVGAVVDRHDNIWVLSWSGGLCRFDPKTETFEKFLWNARRSNATNIPFDIAETYSANGQRIFWIAAEHGLLRMPLEAGAFPALAQRYDLIAADSGAGLLPEGQVIRLLADQEGNLWAGSTGAGVFRRHIRQENFLHLKNALEAPIEKITFALNGDALVSGLGDPISVWDSRLIRKKQTPRFPASTEPDLGRLSWGAARDEASGIMYIATFDGLVAWDENQNRMRRYPFNLAEPGGLLHRRITQVFPLGNGHLLLAFWMHYLQLFDANTGKTIKLLGKQGSITRQITKDAAGNIWVCGEGFLARFEPAKALLTDVLRDETIYLAIFFDAKNRCWLGTNKGLLQFDLTNRRILARYGFEEGLPGNEVSGIRKDSLGRLWLMTNKGVCFFDPDARRPYTLGKADGLVLPHAGAKMGQAPDGRIWLAEGRDIQIFQPELIRTPAPSRVYITGLKINQRDTFPEAPFGQLTEMRLRPGENDLAFLYTAIDLESFGRTRFLYRLDGLQNEWVRAGKNRMAVFVNLPAGAYTFRVRPEDAGDNAAFDATLRIVVTDFVWQRRWFQALALFLLGGLIAFAYYRWNNQRLRLRLAKLEHVRAMEALRLDIAQDIHDEVGADLTKISLSAQFTAMLPHLSGAELRDKLRAISVDAREVAVHLGDIVFAINPHYDHFAEVQAYFREKGRAFLEEARLEAYFDLPPAAQNPLVPPEVKRQLYLLFRESLNNAVKHAQAKSVRIALRLEAGGQRFLLEICDDGAGFDLQNTRIFGNGLAAMRARAEKIGARLTVDTAPGQGTRIRVEGNIDDAGNPIYQTALTKA
ncbi:MAG: hypothetical protein IPM81_14105 [Saprospirales bacterium]|nr:hypothetical protein [Saprospirales bacterium]